MGRYMATRLSLFIPTLLLVTIVLFVILRIVPGDPALMLLVGSQGEGAVDPEELAALRHQLGTDRPLFVQYYTWIWDTLRGDFGTSMWYDDPVWEEIREKFPVTLELVILGIVIGFGTAVPLGLLSAVKQDSWLDYVARIFTVAGIALPSFWLGILLIFLLVRAFNWAPPLGYEAFWEDPLKNLQQMVFPAMVLGYFNMAFVARVTRSAMLDVLREDYIRTAYSKGLRGWVVISRHALRNAFLPILTVSGWQVGRLIGGTVVIESVFLVPGVGQVLIEAIGHRDFTMIQAFILLIAFAVLSLNLIIDVLYAWFDPRIRYT